MTEGEVGTGYLIPGWQQAHKLWSVRVAIFWAVVSGAYIALPAFIAAVPPIAFAGICIGMSIVLVVARITNQPGVN